MLRLSPPGFERFLQTPAFVATFGGGEAKSPVCVAQFGLESRYVTRLPAQAIGDAAVRALRAEGVRTDSSSAAAIASASTTPRRGRASAPRPSSTIAPARPSAR
jgi:sugar/nucleoside kinase (ribokinase family)